MMMTRHRLLVRLLVSASLPYLVLVFLQFSFLVNEQGTYRRSLNESGGQQGLVGGGTGSGSSLRQYTTSTNQERHKKQRAEESYKEAHQLAVGDDASSNHQQEAEAEENEHQQELLLPFGEAQVVDTESDGKHHQGWQDWFDEEKRKNITYSETNKNKATSVGNGGKVHHGDYGSAQPPSNNNIYNETKILPRAIIVPLPPSNTKPMNDNRIYFFLHIHKSGGTNMCIAARSNNMSVSGKNCNVQKDQRCCGDSDGLISQRGYAMISSYNFVANEADMYEAMDPQHYRYIILLRDSRDRYESHWKNVCRQHHHNFTESFDVWSRRQPDNWNVRKICGTRCMKVPKFQISEKLFNYTLDRLRMFDDILFLENFNESYTQFANRVGWKRMAIPKPESHEEHDKFNYPPLSVKDGTSSLDPLMTALDDALYEYAQGLYRGVKAVPQHLLPRSNLLDAMKIYFTDGQSRKCYNECCHDECSVY